MTQNFVSRRNQDGILRSNTALRLAGIVVHDKDVKEYPKLKSITHISATSLNLKPFLSDSELYSAIANLYKQPKDSDFPEIEGCFRFAWFDESS